MDKQEKEMQIIVTISKLVNLHLKAGNSIRNLVSSQEKIATRPIWPFDEEDINGELGNIQASIMEMDTILQKLHLLTKK